MIRRAEIKKSRGCLLGSPVYPVQTHNAAGVLPRIIDQNLPSLNLGPVDVLLSVLLPDAAVRWRIYDSSFFTLSTHPLIDF